MISDDEWEDFLDGIANNPKPETTEYPVTLTGLRNIAKDIALAMNTPAYDEAGYIIVDDEILGDLRKYAKVLNCAADILELGCADIANIQVNEEDGTVDFINPDLID